MIETIEQKSTLAIDEKQVEQFAGQVITDMAAAMSGVMTLIGHELGLYKAMLGKGPMTPSELAEKTGTFARYVQEWLNNQAAGGYVNYNPHTKTYELPTEHAAVLAIEDSPAFMAAGFNVVSSVWYDKEKIVKDFKDGKGVGWHEHHHNLFFGTEAFFRTGYKVNLVTRWIPLLTGIEEKLQNGGRVADVGCGHGASTIIMAQKYPASNFFGYDYHKGSIDVALQRAKEAGLNNIHFEVASADNFAEDNLDLVCFMDSFHDMGNPLSAISHARTRLAPGGSVMLVEPASSDKVEENFNPLGRMYYAASTALCVPNSHSQEGDYCLGAQAGPSRVEAIVKDAGFESFRIADRTPVNLVYEAK
jgi:SAM-dependent methyltransferase